MALSDEMLHALQAGMPGAFGEQFAQALVKQLGFTKREVIALVAMNGIMTTRWYDKTETVVRQAFRTADAFLNANELLSSKGEEEIEVEEVKRT